MFLIGREVGLLELICGLCSNWWACVCGVRESGCGREKGEGLRLALERNVEV